MFDSCSKFPPSPTMASSQAERFCFCRVDPRMHSNAALDEAAAHASEDCCKLQVTPDRDIYFDYKPSQVCPLMPLLVAKTFIGDSILIYSAKVPRVRLTLTTLTIAAARSLRMASQSLLLRRNAVGIDLGPWGKVWLKWCSRLPLIVDRNMTARYCR
jgi:hypothetical protein